MLDKLKEFINKMNKAGVPVPFLRDPKTGVGSISLTLVFISANMVILSLIGSVNQLVKGIDVSNSLEFLMISLGAYLGRQYQKGSGISAPPTDPVKPE